MWAVIDVAKSKPNSQTWLAGYKSPPITPQNLAKPVSDSAELMDHGKIKTKRLILLNRSQTNCSEVVNK
jgi:hypothetical protein